MNPQLRAPKRGHVHSPPRPAARSTASPPAKSSSGRPRRSRSCRERARRRREPHRRRHRSGRARPHPRRRRRARHGRRGSRAVGRAPRHLENSRRRSRRDRDARLSRRGAALDRRPFRGSKSAPARAARRKPSRCASRTASRSALRPSAHPIGTRVEARDLFAATPARLKFLKTDRAKRRPAPTRCAASRSPIAQTRFSFSTEIGASFDWPACSAGEAGERERMRQALGEDFVANALRIDASREGVRLTGWVGLPTLNKPNALTQVFLRQRPRRARQTDRRRVARGLSRLSPARAPRRRGAHTSLATRARSTSTSIPPRRRCAFATAAWCAASIVGAVQAGARRRAAPRDDHRRREHARRDARAAMAGNADAGAHWDWRASPAAPDLASANRFAESAQASFGDFAPAADAAPAPRRRRAPTSPRRSAPRARKFTTPISSPRRATAWSSSTSTPRTNASSTRS